MRKPVRALDSALLQLRVAAPYTEVRAGHWLHGVSGRVWPGDPLFGSWVWQVVEGPGQLELRADGLTERVTVSEEAVADLVLFVPAERVRMADYLELLSWHRACRWGLALTDRDDGWVQLHYTRYGSRINTRAFGAIADTELYQPETVWLHLLTNLYSLVHPGKVQAYGDLKELPEPERSRFVRELRRKAARQVVETHPPATGHRPTAADAT